MFIVGLDLGQARDYTALAIIEKQEGGSAYQVRKLERTRGTPYPDVVARTQEILGKLPGAKLVVDATGVGQPVVDMFVKAGLKPIGIYIHGGDRVSHENSTWRVPKRDLVAVLQVLTQRQQDKPQRLQVTPGPLSDILTGEMLNFRVKIDPATAHDSYSAWREADHDDLVLAVALACWWGEHGASKKRYHFNVPKEIVTGGNMPSVIWDYVSPEVERAREAMNAAYDKRG
jgi:hypothetical protein